LESPEDAARFLEPGTQTLRPEDANVMAATSENSSQTCSGDDIATGGPRHDQETTGANHVKMMDSASPESNALVAADAAAEPGRASPKSAFVSLKLKTP
jgi:hypothetical protein